MDVLLSHDRLIPGPILGPTRFRCRSEIPPDLWFCRKVRFWGKIQKSGVRNSMAYRCQHSRKSNFATEPPMAPDHPDQTCPSATVAPTDTFDQDGQGPLGVLSQS